MLPGASSIQNRIGTTLETRSLSSSPPYPPLFSMKATWLTLGQSLFLRLRMESMATTSENLVKKIEKTYLSILQQVAFTQKAHTEKEYLL